MLLYSTYNDGQLLELLKSGDEKAFEVVYLRYWDKLFYLAAKKLDDLYAAESIIQDVFLDIWNRRESLIIKTTIDAYLVVAVKYRVINEQAKRYRQYETEQQLAHNFSEADYSTQQLLSFEELQELLQQHINKLPEKCRMAFIYREEGYSYREIAQKMDISEKTVEMHVSKALKSLRTGLGIYIVLLSLWY